MLTNNNYFNDKKTIGRHAHNTTSFILIFVTKIKIV